MRFDKKVIIIIIFFACTISSAKIIYVDDDANGVNDGSSWQNAYKYLQDALFDAQNAEKPVEIRVAQGIYKPDLGAGQTLGDRGATFRLIDVVNLKGGYAGVNELNPNERNVKLYETILSGDLNNNDSEVNDPCELLIEPTRAENSYHVVICVIDGSVLDGFTITGGNANLTPYRTASIEGVLHDSYSNISFNNYIVYVNVRGFVGGGLCNYSNLSVSNCTFSKNSAAYGGGVFNEGTYITAASTFNDCEFKGNYADAGGGMLNSNFEIKLYNCMYSENSAKYNGGGIQNSYSNTILEKCTFFDNNADSGAGIANNDYCDSILTNCVLGRNNSNNEGGGIYNYRCSNLVLNECKIFGNRAISCGGGIYDCGKSNHESNSLMKNCVFSGNLTSKNGGGIYVYFNSNPTLINCTFVGNRGVKGKSLYCRSQYGKRNNIKLTNCILLDGESENIDIIQSNLVTLAVTYSNIQGSWEGQGNLDFDPLFAKPGYWADANDSNIIVEPNNVNAIWIDGDYHLKSQAGRWDANTQTWVQDDVISPCIDAGDPNSPIGYEPFPNGGRINMGAYGGTSEASKSYFGKPVCTTIVAGDINGDCKVDILDLEIMMSHWLEEH